jgi:aldehyde:ferredoxin oxidoreductase
MFGYTGKILRVNLTTGDCKVENLDENLAKKYIGGRGLGTKMYYDEVSPKIDALSEENKIFFVTGPLTGTPTVTTARYMVVTKSPLSDTIASSNSGGYWGPELKFAGYDMIIVEGKADKPSYLMIEDDKVEVRDADHIWGKVVSETTEILQNEVAKKSRVLAIGPAGEKLSKIAAIMNDVSRAAGRSGVGAVMGSKNLKAITVRGTNKVEVADEEGLKKAHLEMLKKIRENGVTGEGLPTYGTAVLVNIINETGVFPTHNFQLSQFSEAEEVSGETLTEKYLVKKDPCYR